MTEVLLIVGDRGNTPRLVGLVERLGSAGLTVASPRPPRGTRPTSMRPWTGTSPKPASSG